MDFLEAYKLILESKGKKKEFYLCDDISELNGVHESICVYCDEEFEEEIAPGIKKVVTGFVGKLRWKDKDGRPSVDGDLEKALKEML